MSGQHRLCTPPHCLLETFPLCSFLELQLAVGAFTLIFTLGTSVFCLDQCDCSHQVCIRLLAVSLHLLTCCWRGHLRALSVKALMDLAQVSGEVQ